MKTKKKMRTGTIIVTGFIAFLLIVICTFLIYVANYYHADDTATEAASIVGGIDISNINGALVFDPGDTDTALIFYPGAKVEYTAYEPLMTKIAQNGIRCSCK